MKYYKNVSTKHLSVGWEFVKKGESRVLDEKDPATMAFVGKGSLKEITEQEYLVGMKVTPNDIDNAKEPASVSADKLPPGVPSTSAKMEEVKSLDASPKSEEPKEPPVVPPLTQDKPDSAQGSVIPGGVPFNEPPATEKYGFASEESSVIVKGAIPGQGETKMVSTHISEVITAAKKDLGDVIDNVNTAVAKPVKKKARNIEDVPEYIRNFINQLYVYKKFKIAFTTDIGFLRDVIKYDNDENTIVIAEKKLKELIGEEEVKQ